MMMIVTTELAPPVIKNNSMVSCGNDFQQNSRTETLMLLFAIFFLLGSTQNPDSELITKFCNSVSKNPYTIKTG